MGNQAIDILINRYPYLAECRLDIEAALELLVGVYRNEGKVLVCGNGGSAADAEHIVGELMKTFSKKRALDLAFSSEYQKLFGEDPAAFLEGSLPAISLVSHTSLSTAVMNDVDAGSVFAQQVYGYGQPGDALIAISTSGASKNVVLAAQVACVKKMRVLALTGQAKSALSGVADVAIRVPCTEIYQIQELHLPVYHALCAALEEEFF